MNYYYPVEFDIQNVVSIEPAFKEIPMTKKADDNEGKGFNLGFFMSDDAKIESSPEVVEAELELKRKRNTRAKPIPASQLPASTTQIQSDTNIAYADSYSETNNILRTAIAQSDQLLVEIKQDIDTIRASKTLKGKYTYLTNLSASAASLINTRITAAREINNSITHAHELELKRTKDIKDMARDDKNDDARMMDLYNAFINNPIGMYENKLNMPTVPNMTLGAGHGALGIADVSLPSGTNEQTALTPEQLRMRMENNPNIEEVVVYDAATGRRWFEMRDTTTNQPIPNYPTSDQFLLEDTSLDIHAQIAKNRNLDKVWPLVVVGEVTEY